MHKVAGSSAWVNDHLPRNVSNVMYDQATLGSNVTPSHRTSPHRKTHIEHNSRDLFVPATVLLSFYYPLQKPAKQWYKPSPVRD